MKVLTQSLEDVEITPLMEGGGLILHKALPPKEGFTVTHAKTGAALFSGQPREVAEEFFQQASGWPEWRQGELFEDFQYLRDRVMKLRAAVLQLTPVKR
jgi:hypothetical protein